jgi:hypothetical protein
MLLDRRVRDAKVSLLYTCCRRGFVQGRLPRRADRLLWTLKEHLELPAQVAAAAIESARTASLREPRRASPMMDAKWITTRAHREVERFELQGSDFEADLEFLRAALAAPHLARGSLRGSNEGSPSQPGCVSQVLPRQRSSVRVDRRRWRPGRGLRAMALGLVVALGLASVGEAWSLRADRAQTSMDARGHRRTLLDLLGREAVAGEDLEVEILATYQALYAASPDGPERSAVREEWAAYLRRERR